MCSLLFALKSYIQICIIYKDDSNVTEKKNILYTLIMFFNFLNEIYIKIIKAALSLYSLNNFNGFIELYKNEID